MRTERLRRNFPTPITISLPEDHPIRCHLRNAAALIAAVNEGELLSALPPDPADRARHNTGVLLLGMIEELLQRAATLLTQEEAASFGHGEPVT